MGADKTTAIIIGSARGRRHLDPTKSLPFSMETFADKGRVLDWILHAFEKTGIKSGSNVFVGGYHIQKVIKAYPSLKFYFHENWEKEGEAAALKLAAADILSDAFICGGDVVFRPEALDSLRKKDFDVVVGFPGVAGDDDPESALPKHPVGPAWLSARAVKHLKKILSSAAVSGRDMFWVLGELEKSGLRMSVVDIRNHCGLLRDQLSLSRFVFGTKAITLERLRPLVKTARVLDQVRFNVGDWMSDREAVLAQVEKKLSSSGRLVVRSSALAEDTWGSSQAGRFDSVLGVDALNRKDIDKAVEHVIASYPGADVPETFAQNEVFIQPQLDGVESCGVIFTRDQQTNAPFTIINLDRRTGRTDVVTSGDRHPTETFIVSDRKAGLGDDKKFLRPLLAMVDELETLVGYGRLDIEFAVDGSGQVYVFQVRPLAGSAVEMEVSEQSLKDELAQIRKFCAALTKPICGMLGRSTMFGSMPDWNPAEMIGTAPRPLARSLYQVLITDGAWARAREIMGYRDMTAHPLMCLFAGVPYIDLRASFNSFLPAGIPDDTGARIVNVYLDCLKNNPELHDKIEFDVALTCIAFDFKAQVERLCLAGLGKDDADVLVRELRELTDSFVKGEGAGAIDECINKVKTLELRRKAALDGVCSAADVPRTVWLLVRDCINFGTVPFSILARHGFVAMTFLKSLVARNALSAAEYHEILSSVPTVASGIPEALAALASGKMTKESFIEKFGHLRPGTYDILSPNYARLADSFASTAPATDTVPAASGPGRVKEIFRASEPKVSVLIAEAGLGFSTDELCDYICAAIPAREWAKFEFTKNINAVLENVAVYFDSFGLTREDASFVSIENILRHATDSLSGAEDFETARTVAFEQKRHVLTKSLRLPHLITSASDIDCFCMEQWRPNYITDKKILADICWPDNEDTGAETLNGKIAVIRSADPGYDWIFGCGIKGLITEFGGAASHMAIRAAEFGLPSAIGCGGELFEKVLNASRVELDCANKIIKVF